MQTSGKKKCCTTCQCSSCLILSPNCKKIILKLFVFSAALVNTCPIKTYNLIYIIHICLRIVVSSSAGSRTNEAMCQLSHEAPNLGPEGGRPGRPTQASRHLESLRNRTPSNLKLHHISKNPSYKKIWQEDGPHWPMGPCA